MDSRKMNEPRACAMCGKPFVPKVGNSKFCGPDCKREKALERARQQTIEKQKRKLKSEQIVDVAKEAKAHVLRSVCSNDVCEGGKGCKI